MRVIKLGGSLFHTPELRQWLELLDSASQQDTVVIVPGGGPFADEVRHAQRLHRFSDSSAHHMALLAMAQFGLLIADLAPESQIFYYPQQDPQQLPPGLHVWLPDRSLLESSEISHSWDVSSDSLALWLSQELEADELVMIKRSTVVSSRIQALIQHGVIDKGFTSLYQRKPVLTKLFHFQQQALFPDNGLVLR
ncbi:delta 1-pyrroline-5-carboxylate synthetase [uncultured Methylophaga sp.]|uniref:amino acid kinase family protein n=1 Tax=uncultured Methylophaga sp. TaxID=285271 RepID=UPI002603225E|nr:delta 1-pyrroline-5-carboxylate synthetase [uncultured Methylophaga sp.]